MKKKALIIIAILVLGGGLMGLYRQLSTVNSSLAITPTIVPLQQNTVTYKGIEGEDALAVLQKQVKVVQDDTGLVISINGRKAEKTKREYWAFYINGKMAQVGPKDYITKNGDTIVWKIETY